MNANKARNPNKFGRSIMRYVLKHVSFWVIRRKGGRRNRKKEDANASVMETKLSLLKRKSDKRMGRRRRTNTRHGCEAT